MRNRLQLGIRTSIVGHGQSPRMSQIWAAHRYFSEVRGINGVTMKEMFEPEPQVYLGLTVPKFPNYFVVNGPRGAWASGSVLASVSI